MSDEVMNPAPPNEGRSPARGRRFIEELGDKVIERLGELVDGLAGGSRGARLVPVPVPVRSRSYRSDR